MPPSELEQIKNMLSIHMEVSQRRHDETQKALTELNTAVFENKKLGVEGVVLRVETLEKKDKARAKREWIGIGAALVSGFSLSKLGAAIIEIFTKHQ